MGILDNTDNTQGRIAITLLSSRFNELERNKAMEIITNDSYSIERNKISFNKNISVAVSHIIEIHTFIILIFV